jgi:uncharacterized protein (DUF1330 family)
MMPGYVVLSVEVLDAERYQEYARMGGPTVAQYGGRYLVRGGQVDRRDGTWEPKRLVIIEFSSVDQAKRWWDSPEYAPARELREACAVSDVVIVEGVAT